MPNSKPFNLSDKTIRNIIIGVSSLVLIPYALWFISHPVSRYPEDWGNFGDYVGGILNPLLTILNIYLIIKLSAKVETREDLKAVKDIKLKVYSELAETLFEYDIKRIKFDKSEYERAQKLQHYLGIYEITNNYLFEGDELFVFNSIMQDIKLNVDGIKSTVVSYSPFDPNKNYGSHQNRIIMSDLSEKGNNQLNMLTFLQPRFEAFLLGFIQSSLSGKNVEKFNRMAKSKFNNEIEDIKSSFRNNPHYPNEVIQHS